jgi:penicillin-binding protein 1A
MIPETVMVDKPVSINGWKPTDYERTYRGPVTLQTALADSLNTVAAQVTQIVTPQAVAATARRLGIVSPLMATPSIALGTSVVTPLELTAAYVPFSNGGRGIIPYAIKRIVTASGKVLYQRSGTGPGRVINPVYVGMMNSMLEQTVINGTGTRAQIPGWQVAGKTGTSQQYRDAWFVGYTGVLTTGVWFGNDNDTPTKRVTGGSLPAIAWHRFMSAALKGQAVADLPGNYQFGNPANARYAGRPIYPSDMTAAQAQSAPLVLGPGGSGALAAGPQIAQGGPVPPGMVGQRRREGPITSFLQKLFGG